MNNEDMKIIVFQKNIQNDEDAGSNVRTDFFIFISFYYLQQREEIIEVFFMGCNNAKTQRIY